MQYFMAVRSLVRMQLRRFFRNRVALFFTFLFPVIFLLIFGSLFKTSAFHFHVAVFNDAKTPYANGLVKEIEKTKGFNVANVDSMSTAKTELGEGQLDSIVVLPPGFGEPDSQGVPAGTAVSYYEQANPQSGQQLSTVLQSILDTTNNHFYHQQKPLKVASEPAQTTNLTEFDYTFSGLLGFSILSLGIFGMANGFATDKANGALRRLRVSPIRASQLVMATAAQYVVVGLLSLALMYFLAVRIFNFHMHGSYLSLIVFAILSIVMIFGFGLTIAGWAKDEKQAAPLANLVGIPMMFLSGSFFPRYLMPEWLQHISGYLPLSPVVDGMRYIVAEGKTLPQVLPQIGLIAAWGVVIYIVAFYVFRWE
ncbi:MAG TPA: ABC transporter permease [Candidatus Saccharimonadales bacterium]|nr:ABC transporter permease [Candidatus Saccharimonadales bacterium]